MDGGSAAFLPRLPVVRRNYTLLPGEIIEYPIPCHLIGRPELVYVYFVIGCILPIIASIYVHYDAITGFLQKKVRNRNCTCKRAEAGAETEEKAELAEDLGVDAPAVDRLEAIAAAMAHRSRLEKFLAEASSAQTNLGQIMMGIAVCCSTTSLFIYLGAVSRKRESLEMCGTMPAASQIIDLFANLYLLAYFLIRLTGSDKKRQMVTSFDAVVDYMTIPSVVLGVVLNRYFTGFSFFRAHNFKWLVEILAYRRVLKSVNTVRLIRLIVLVLGVMIIAAGFLHMVENMGDPFLYDPKDGVLLYNGQNIIFWRCFLYVYGRITLLDLSMMRMHTMLGRVIIYGFQILALGIVGQAIPQIVARFKVKPDYDKSYTLSQMFIHIVVCGQQVSAHSMEAFLKEFYHPDRDTSELFKIVILCEERPDEDMQILIERYFTKLDYLRGTVMNIKDLNRIKVVDAKAVLILADRSSSDSDAHDAANIMRVVSLKNYKDDTQIIVQLAQYHNKAYLQNIPSWKPEKGDIVICLAELRLGLLAQSCSAPGFSTLMANFFTTRTFDAQKKYRETERHMEYYERGSALELYCRPFSIAFIGMTFAQAAEFCYRRLKIVLLAIQNNPNDSCSSPMINPGPTVIIMDETVGYFIADATHEVDRAQFYCKKCHVGIDDPTLIKRCACIPEDEKGLISGIQTLKDLPMQSSLLAHTATQINETGVEAKIYSYISHYPNTPAGSTEDLAKQQVELDANIISGDDAVKITPAKSAPHLYDSTGHFYWCPARPMNRVVMSRKQAATTAFNDHIVVCVLSQPNSQLLGLASFVMPLRSSVIPIQDLKQIVILGDPKFLEKEWKYLYNLPKITIVKGTALNRSDLRTVNLNTCRMCVILGAVSAGEKITDPSMLDKSVILATLNVRAMKFSEEEQPSFPPLKSEAVVPLTATSDLLFKDSPYPHRKTGDEVPLITDLVKESNVAFLDDDDEDLPGTAFYLTQPYAGGRAFAGSVLDLLTITTFFNPTIIKVINSIVFGGASLELERISAEGAGLIGGDDISRHQENGEQVSVVQISLESGPLSLHATSCYGGLFVDALVNFGLVTLGLFRQFDSTKRYVITNPPETFEVNASDFIFALKTTTHKEREPVSPATLRNWNCVQKYAHSNDERADWEFQPPLRGSSGAASSNRLVDMDVKSLESALNVVNEDVAQMQKKFQHLSHRQTFTNSQLTESNRIEPVTTDSEPTTEASPLLDSAALAFIPSVPVPESITPTNYAIETDLLLSLEKRLGIIRRDVATMNERYLKMTYHSHDL